MRDAIQMGLGERTVTVNREQLLATLKENREKHQKEYQESVAGYKVLAGERLAKLHAKAEAALMEQRELLNRKIAEFDPEDEDRLDDHVTLINTMTFHLKVPVDHTSSYDVAIKMAEWEVADVVELTQGQFQCFVMDDWDWQEEFKHLNKAYSVAAMRQR
jgi:hypothetical protein